MMKLPIMHGYNAFVDGRFEFLGLKQLLELHREDKIWSARLGTGILGHTNCFSGNFGPKEDYEVVLAAGNAGLVKLVELGFVTCPVCRPDNSSGFNEIVSDTVQRTYGLDMAGFCDRKILPFDAARVNFEYIIPHTGRFPSRVYLPKGLDDAVLRKHKERFLKLNPQLPTPGYYDANAPGRFAEYRWPE